MNRRQLLALTGTGLSALVAGCGATTEQGAPSDGTTPTGEPTTSPMATDGADSAVTAPVYATWSAYNDRDRQGVVEPYHPESPDAPVAADIELHGTVTVESATVVSRSGDSATVEASVTVEAERSESQTLEYVLRRTGGEWQIWTVETPGTGSGPATPQAQFGFTFDGSPTADSGTAVLRIQHERGDTIDAGKLSIRGSGIVETTASTDVTASGTNWGSATGDSDVSAGTAITVGVESDCVVRVVWASDSASATLGWYQGPG